MTQLAFDLPHRTALGREDFLVSASNREAVAWIDRWPDWPAPALVLYGPEGCGKTHLLHLWQERALCRIVDGARLDAAEVPRLLAESGARIAIENGEHAAERALLHLYNACAERQGSLLFAARRPPASWSFALADLSSRLRAAPAIPVGAADEELVAALLVKHFADRQLRVAPEVIGYLLPRIERSAAAAAAFAARLDALALARGRRVTIALARALFHSSPPSDFGVT
jgi:chromosomal replication initiation ATPase DnaA